MNSTDETKSDQLENKKPNYNEKKWSVNDSAALYGLERWGKPYFSINSKGNISINPNNEDSREIDLFNLVKELEGRNLKLPLIIRIDDILEDRVRQINESFKKAIKTYKYDGEYKGVYPIKCNQQKHVIEELLRSGDKWNLGLEAGSKAELLISLSLITNANSLLICNGYKDNSYIETTILARQLGLKPILVIEQADEVDRILIASKKLGAAPLIGIRAKLSTENKSRWGSSIGEKSKFGLSVPEILKTVNLLKESDLLQELKLLHFHVGSQINDIGILKNALQEAGQIYTELKRLGAPMGYLDVGGGLGVDYDGSKTATSISTNYSLQNYANDVVATIQECCASNNIKSPCLISESGRALSSHFSILVFNILGKTKISADIPKLEKEECQIIKNLRTTLKIIKSIPKNDSSQISKLQESWNDALKFKEDALAGFRLGYINLIERGIAEKLTWACADAVVNKIPSSNKSHIPKEITNLKSFLAQTYYANLSIFRSAPDTWAIQQLFPVMPIHRLNEKPELLGDIADLTCDSDGKLSKFINNGNRKNLLELHELNKKDDYILGMFLGGSYQEVLGNIHNLFGSTNTAHIRLTSQGKYSVKHVIRGDTKADVLEAMEHDPQIVLEKLRVSSEVAIQKGKLKISDAQRLIEYVEKSLRESTYLQE